MDNFQDECQRIASIVVRNSHVAWELGEVFVAVFNAEFCYFLA